MQSIYSSITLAPGIHGINEPHGVTTTHTSNPDTNPLSATWEAKLAGGMACSTITYPLAIAIAAMPIDPYLASGILIGSGCASLAAGYIASGIIIANGCAKSEDLRALAECSKVDCGTASKTKVAQYAAMGATAGVATACSTAVAFKLGTVGTTAAVATVAAWPVAVAVPFAACALCSRDAPRASEPSEALLSNHRSAYGEPLFPASSR